jgi:Calx-beta domain/FG-GAP-like repeat
MTRHTRLHLEALDDRMLPSFLWAGSYPVASVPGAVVTADFNNDGHLDLAADTGDLLLGDGQGGFVAGSGFPGGSFAVADVNKDGNLDLATASGSSHDVSILLGNGDGTFRTPLATAVQGWAPVAADFNADGNMDLVYISSTVLNGWDCVEVSLGDGQGSFAAQHLYPIHTTDLRRLTVADLNGDGRPDVATANYNEGTVSVLLGNGDGTLSYDFDSSNFAAGTDTEDVAAGDFTGDGIPDLIATGYDYGGWVKVLPGRGDGTFAAGILTEVAGGAWSPPTDFNGDGRLDFLTAYWTMDLGGNASLFLGRGDGTFVGEGVGGVGLDTPEAIAAGDFNGDGRPDMAVAGIDFDGGGAVTVQLNDGDWPDPNLPRLQVWGVRVTEGNTGTVPAVFTVTLSAASTQPVTVQYATADGLATAGTDYRAASGTITFAPGETSKTITVLVNGDRLAEPTEDFSVNLSAPTNARIDDGSGWAWGIILDDEPRISIHGASVKEGNGGTRSMTFTVTLSVAYDQPVTVNFATADGTAKVSDNDYAATSGTLTFAPGQTMKTITVQVKGDKKKEPDEYFYLLLSDPSSDALISNGSALGWVLNDD